MEQARLIPYKIQQEFDKTDEIPAGVEMIQAPKLWEKGFEGQDIVIAVIDTGCDKNHPDLRNRIIGGRNFTSDNRGNIRNFNDGNGHGTHVAGTIAATLNNRGVAGVAPKAKLLILKALDNNGGGSFDSIIHAIEYATQWRGRNNERVRVMSMSFGTSTDLPELHQSIQEAVANDILVVCAAGNEGDGNARTSERMYPGYYKEVVQVGAVDHEGNMAAFTNTNDEIDLVAPGVDVVSTYLNRKYAKLSGTSMATPHVSGAAAIIIEQMEKEFDRTLTEPEIYAQLIKATTPLKNSKKVEGNGLITLNKEHVSFNRSCNKTRSSSSSKAKNSKSKGNGFVVPDAEV
ncbi:S8 family peptidase [Aquibacillus albus]|uniref:Major intracellular serine protease n=1 Tax=Aquibacillus albus TaxID=1168171 RepID=A0ABS2N5G6_9BACI|nr:S8 family peptidase [Aquibacillus albus]MBM7573361.1 major intracellular serine protease [Aquibacillus albus]